MPGIYRCGLSDGTVVEREAEEPQIMDLGRVEVIAEVSVNGQDVGTLWHAPYQVDITPYLQAAHGSFTTYSPWNEEARLFKAGLIGPVKLKFVTEQKL